MSKKTWIILSMAFSLTGMVLTGCTKNGVDSTNPCDNVNIVINGAVTNASGPGLANGAIQVTATGAAQLLFSLNGGAFQSGTLFSSLAPGTYSITARSEGNCTATATFTVNAGDPCQGKNILVNVSIGGSDKCASTGTVAVNATGSNGFTYRLNASGSFQGTSSFAAVPAGNHVVFVRDAGGCEVTSNIVIPTLSNGTLFNGVATMLRTRCSPCHTTSSDGGANFGSDCNIVALKERIKVRAVDMNNMPPGGPPLNAAEKKMITDWIGAGGLSSN